MSTQKYFEAKVNIRIHHECPCRIGKSHPRGGNFNQGQGWLKSLPGGWNFPILHGLAHDGFSPTFKRIIPRTSRCTSWSCKIGVSHMGKKPSSFRKRWEKIVSQVFTSAVTLSGNFCQQNVKDSCIVNTHGVSISCAYTIWTFIISYHNYSKYWDP